jgi:2',3'-cyclic-nucleotide 2'-phosphodiesterase (5'-nucleotidase family)
MKSTPERNILATTADGNKPGAAMTDRMLHRREFLAASAAIGVTILLPGFAAAAPAGTKSFTILHTNDMHASFIGMGPSADYSPFTLNDDSTRVATRASPA